MDAHVQLNSPPQQSFFMFTLVFLFFASPLPFQRATFVKGSLLIMKKMTNRSLSPLYDYSPHVIYITLMEKVTDYFLWL